MTPSVLVLDTVSRVAPLGVRFWDITSQSAATGMIVSVHPQGQPELKRFSITGRTGIHSFHSLPGLSGVTMADGTDAWWAGNAGQRSFELEAAHITGDYLAYRLPVQLPHRGLLGLPASPALASLTPDDTWLPAFPSPSRLVESSLASIRAQVQDSVSGLPASWTLCEAQAGSGPPAYGLADRRGILNLALAYPEPENFGLASPFGGARIPITRQSWPVNFRFFYSAIEQTGASPDLRQIVTQPEAMAWEDAARTIAFSRDNLTFGQELVLRTADSAGFKMPVLLLTPTP